jgi:hypothetical protein
MGILGLSRAARDSTQYASGQQTGDEMKDGCVDHDLVLGFLRLNTPSREKLKAARRADRSDPVALSSTAFGINDTS